MSFLKEAFKRIRKPEHEGRGIKVYRFNEPTPTSPLKDFFVAEGWGWEDVWEDMKEDASVRRLIKDVKKLVANGLPVSEIADQLQFLEDKASTHLTTEEKAVLLKWLEKNEQELKGPERGLAAYNRHSERSNRVNESTNPADKHQKKIAIDTVKNPAKALLGGPSVKEAEKILRDKFGYTDKQIAKLKEAVEPLDPGMSIENQLEELTKRMFAARKGLGLANRLTGRDSTIHRSRVMTNLNEIRKDLSRVITELEQANQSPI